ncbi:molybdopterin cofactor-binding domain-containing protein, partial [Streptomyces sp. NPDC006197]|uniref:xanthine dehydrogenase family protein molybdopterin-binding subunit n=1 Tax=Streptomyces sp. NPDC006197 TaxID=3156685 RepID=UPI0033B96377
MTRHEPATAQPPAAVRRDARQKVTGEARYAVDRTPPGCLHACPVPAAVARGRVTAVHADEILRRPGVHAVLTYENAPRLGDAGDPTLALLQEDRVPHRGWFVAVVVADTPENARAAADALRIEYAQSEHDVRLSADHPRLYTPEKANGGHPAVRERGDFDTAFAASPVRLDATYTMGALHNHPMEPHAATAWWDDDGLTVYDSSQGATTVRDVLTRLFRLPQQQITVVSAYVGGGFGSKGTPRPPAVLAAMAARHTGRPVRLALPRRDLPAAVVRGEHRAAGDAGDLRPAEQHHEADDGPDGVVA